MVRSEGRTTRGHSTSPVGADETLKEDGSLNKKYLSTSSAPERISLQVSPSELLSIIVADDVIL